MSFQPLGKPMAHAFGDSRRPQRELFQVNSVPKVVRQGYTPLLVGLDIINPNHHLAADSLEKMGLHDVGMNIHVYPDGSFLFELLKKIRSKFNVGANDFESEQWFRWFSFGKQYNPETTFPKFSHNLVFAKEHPAGRKGVLFDLVPVRTRERRRMRRRFVVRWLITVTKEFSVKKPLIQARDSALLTSQFWQIQVPLSM